MRAQSALLLALLAIGGPAGAQTSDAPRPVQAFEEMIDVQAVNLEAVVTDSRGRRVTGLAAEDFRLLVDGVETPITYFSQIAEAAAGGDNPAGKPSWQSRNILVFLDEATMVKARRDFVVRSLATQLEDLTSGDQVAVVSFTGSQLEVLCEWTGDRARLASVLATIEGRPAGGAHMEAARRAEKSDETFEDLAVPYDMRASDIEEEFFSSASGQRSRRLRPTELFNPLGRYLAVGEAVAGAMRGLSAPHGRKMLMLLTEGFQHPIFVQEVVEEATRLGYSLYPVDVKGLDTFRAQNDVEFARPQGFAVSSSINRGIDYTLTTMAASTGGKASLNSNRLEALDRLVEDSASYYVLGFSPTWRGDDRRHEIKLTAARPGLKVRTRDSYVDTSRRTRLDLEADASLLLGRSDEEQRLAVTIDKATDSVIGGKKIMISLSVPVESLAFVPRGNSFHAEAPFAMVVLNDKGERRNLKESWLSIDLDQLPLEGTYAQFNVSLDAGSRAQRVVVTVHDALSGEALWGEAFLEEKAREAR